MSDSPLAAPPLQLLRHPAALEPHRAVRSASSARVSSPSDPPSRSGQPLVPGSGFGAPGVPAPRLPHTHACAVTAAASTARSSLAPASLWQPYRAPRTSRASSQAGHSLRPCGAVCVASHRPARCLRKCGGKQAEPWPYSANAGAPAHCTAAHTQRRGQADAGLCKLLYLVGSVAQAVISEHAQIIAKHRRPGAFVETIGKLRASKPLRRSYLPLPAVPPSRNSRQSSAIRGLPGLLGCLWGPLPVSLGLQNSSQYLSS